MDKQQLKSKSTQRRLRNLADILHKYTYPILFLCALLTIVFGVLASRLEQKTTIRDLLPAHNKVVRNFEETVKNFDLVDRVVVVLQFKPENLELAEAFADIFVDQTLADEQSEKYLWWLKGNLFDETEHTDWHQYLQFLIRLMPSEQIEAFKQRLTTEGIFDQVKQNRRELESGMGSKALIENDPLNLIEFAGTYSNEITGNYQISFSDGFLVSKTRDMLLILGKPKETPEDVDFSVELDLFLREQIEATHKVLTDEEGVESKDLLSVGLTGPHPITAHENRIIKSDVVNMFVTSFAMVLFLFILAYGRPLALIYVGIPLLCAEIWTLGLGYLLFGRLNLLTATFSAVIVGLGIDYAIHIFSRYLDERSQGIDTLPAMQIALSQTGMGTCIGGLTTALAFLAMGLSRFSGLREFAAIASIGIFLCLVQMFIVLPCLLFMRERLRKGKARGHRAQWDFHMEHLIKLVLGHKKAMLISLGLITIFLGIQAVQLRFNSSIRNVRARSNPSILLQNEVTSKVGGSLRSLTFVFQADTEDGLYDIYESIRPVLASMRAEGSLVRYDSLLAVLQHPQRQKDNLRHLRESGLSSERIEADFIQAMDQQELRVTDNSRAYIENLAAGLDADNPIELRQIIDTGSSFVRPFINYYDGHYRALIHVYPSKGLWEKDATQNLTRRIIEAAKLPEGGDLFVTGIQTIAEELKRLVRESFEWATFLAAFLVFLTLWIHFRNMSLVILTLTPLVVAVAWMLGTMKLLGIDITILNFVATPIIIGIGIDDGVHIVEKFLHRKEENLAKMITSSGKAVTLTSLTTILGFSSLFMAEYSGFQSLGLCAILGVLYCWMGSVLLLPLLLDVCNIRFVRHESDTD